MMKQCETCVDREYNDKLLCCLDSQLSHAFREAVRSIPLIGKHVPEYECRGYEHENS